MNSHMYLLPSLRGLAPKQDFVMTWQLDWAKSESENNISDMSEEQSPVNTACPLCELSGQLNIDSTREDPIEKVLRIIEAEYLPWGEKPVKCQDLNSQALWNSLLRIVQLDWNSEKSNVTNLSSKNDGKAARAEKDVGVAMR